MRTFGEIPGFPEGTRFDSCEKRSKSGVHPATQTGISGSQSEGAESIVLSGGYEDDEDLGDEVVYTGHGGRDAATNKQVEHQTLTRGNLARGNLALAHSSNEGLPVRIVRGANLGSQYAPKSEYRYSSPSCCISAPRPSTVVRIADTLGTTLAGLFAEVEQESGAPPEDLCFP